MSRIHLHQTTTRRPSSTSLDSPTSGLAARSCLATAPMSTSRSITLAAQMLTLPKVRAASGNACITTGPIPTASSSRRPTPTCGEARRATPTPSRVSPMARPTLTWSLYAKARTSRDGCSASWSGPSAGAFWKRRLKTPSRPSKPGTARLEPRERQARHEPCTGTVEFTLQRQQI